MGSKRGLAALAATALLLENGCAAVRADLHHPGGFTGSELDKHMMDASFSKRTQVLRAALITAMVARAGTVYARRGTENQAFVDSIVATTDQINFLAGYVFANGDDAHYACNMAGQRLQKLAAGGTELTTLTAADKCRTFSANFESDVPQLEKSMFQLVVQALPQEAARKFLDSLKGGSFLQTAWSAVKVAFAALDGLHNAAAVNRTSLEIQAAGQKLESSDGDCKVDADATVRDALSCLGLTEDGLFQPSAKQLRLKDDDGSRLLLTAVMQNIEDSCMAIPEALMSGTETEDSPSEAVTAMERSCATIKFNPRYRFARGRGSMSEPAAAPSSTPTTAAGGQTAP